MENEQSKAPTRWTREARLAHMADRLNRLSIEKNMSQADLSRATKLGRDSMSRYFRGMTLPDTLSLVALARALGTEPRDLDPGATAATLPNMTEIAPAMSIREDPAAPGWSFVQINRRMPSSLAARIMVMIADYP
jgi:transcriptional regulator with XRE-family HTH domain